MGGEVTRHSIILGFLDLYPHDDDHEMSYTDPNFSSTTSDTKDNEHQSIRIRDHGKSHRRDHYTHTLKPPQVKGVHAIKVEVPDYYGKINLEEFLDWLSKLENVFT